jgi:hypothetical protein
VIILAKVRTQGKPIWRSYVAVIFSFKLHGYPEGNNDVLLRSKRTYFALPAPMIIITITISIINAADCCTQDESRKAVENDTSK